MLYGDIVEPPTLLIPDNDREWQAWKNTWLMVSQPVGWRFKSLYKVWHEVYTVYFPFRQGPAELQSVARV